MNLFVIAKTNIPDVYIDYIDVRLKSGEEVSLNWAESGITRTASGFEVCYKGVCFGDEPADGRMDDLPGLTVEDVSLYFEANGTFHFQIEEMTFEEGDMLYVVDDSALPQICTGLSGPGEMSLDDKIKSASARTAESSHEPVFSIMEER